jgi:CheY-like chemotaxis protein
MLMDRPAKPRVLVVGDDDFLTRVLKDALGPLEIDAVYVNSAEAALESARQRLPELVLADYALPGRDGMDLLAEIGVLKGHPKRVLLTDRERVASPWGQDIPVLFKPFSVVTLRKLVKELLAAA